MEYVSVVFDAPIGTIENLEKLMATIGHEPEGLAARFAGMIDGKLGIVAVWDSRDAADRFFGSELGPALRTVLGPEPSGFPVQHGLDVLHEYIR